MLVRRELRSKDWERGMLGDESQGTWGYKSNGGGGRLECKNSLEIIQRNFSFTVSGTYEHCPT